VRLEPWGKGDLPLLEKLMGDPEMICRKLGFTLVEEAELEYPPGNFMRCNDWRIDLFVAG
jgi:hypothetical protein